MRQVGSTCIYKRLYKDGRSTIRAITLHVQFGVGSQMAFLSEAFLYVGRQVGSDSIGLNYPLAARSKAWVCGRSLAGIVGSNPAGGMDVCLL